MYEFFSTYLVIIYIVKRKKITLIDKDNTEDLDLETEISNQGILGDGFLSLIGF